MSRIKLFTHTDLDGIGCAIVAYQAFGRENVDVEFCDYNSVNEHIMAFLDEGGPANYDHVYITDISVNEAVAGRIDPISLGKFTLLDHHKTAGWLNKYGWANVVERHSFGTVASGTSLLHSALFPYGSTPEIGAFVEKVRRYDTWEWVALGDEHAKELNDLFHIIGRERFIERFSRNPSVEFTEAERLLLDIERCKIEAYKRVKLRELVTRQIDGYNVGIVFAERYISEVGNYLAQKTPTADFIALINPSLSVSYRGIGKVDVGVFAKGRGGGGHSNAAGSPITDDMRAGIIDIVFGGDNNAVWGKLVLTESKRGREHCWKAEEVSADDEA